MKARLLCLILLAGICTSCGNGDKSKSAKQHKAREYQAKTLKNLDTDTKSTSNGTKSRRSKQSATSGDTSQSDDADLLNDDLLNDFSISGARKNRCLSIYANTYRIMRASPKIDPKTTEKFRATKNLFFTNCMRKSEEELVETERELRNFESKFGGMPKESESDK